MMWVISALIAALVLYALSRYFERAAPFPIPDLDGKRVIYRDWFGAPVFRSERYRIAAKPDMLFEINSNELAAVEYKSRRGPVYESDVAQLVATVIAVREQYSGVTVGYVYTGSGESRRVDCRGTTEELLQSIAGELRYARLTKLGYKPDGVSVVHKCRACGVRRSCDVAVG